MKSKACTRRGEPRAADAWSAWKQNTCNCEPTKGATRPVEAIRDVGRLSVSVMKPATDAKYIEETRSCTSPKNTKEGDDERKRGGGKGKALSTVGTKKHPEERPKDELKRRRAKENK